MRIKIFLIFCLCSFQVSGEGGMREKIREKIAERKADLELERDFFSHIDVNGVRRYFKVHVPASYQKEKSVPLLISLHGGGGNMKLQANDSKYRQISKSESEGYIVVFPNGFSKMGGQIATWNAGHCCGKGRDTNSEDVAFLKALIEKMQSTFSIDKKRIYATGMSNGAMMSYRLACELADLLAGIAAVAGTDNTITCKPSRPISVLHIHAKNDNYVLFNGGAGENAFHEREHVNSFTSVPATISKWVKFNGCDEKPKKIVENNGAWCDLYTGCKENVRVQLCVTEKGGHSWPGGEKVRPMKGETPSSAISANDIMWDFFNAK